MDLTVRSVSALSMLVVVSSTWCCEGEKSGDNTSKDAYFTLTGSSGYHNNMLRILTLLTVVWSSARLTEGVVDCSSGTTGFQCANCKNMVYCSGGQEIMTSFCTGTSVCDDTSDTSCYATDAAQKCKCDELYPNSVKDPYDDTHYLLCLADNNILYLTCNPGETFDDTTNTCQPAPATTTPRPNTCTEQGIFPVLDSCSGYYACIPDGSGGFMASTTVDCPDTQFFDPWASGCSSLPINAPAAPLKCASNTIIVADPELCNAFYICDGTGNVLSGSTSICCDPNHVFNSATLQCEDNTGQVNCAITSPCLPSGYTPACDVPSILTTSTSLSTTTITSTSSSSTTTSSPSTTITSSTTTTSPSTTSTISTTTTSPSTTSTSSSTTTSTTPSTTAKTSSTPSTSTTTSSTTSTTTSSTTTTTIPSTTTPSITTTSTTSITTPSTTTAGPPSCNATNTGSVYEYPGDCVKYYSCYNGNYYVMKCTGILLFNPSSGFCVYPTDYTCPY